MSAQGLAMPAYDLLFLLAPQSLSLTSNENSRDLFSLGLLTGALRP